MRKKYDETEAKAVALAYKALGEIERELAELPDGATAARVKKALRDHLRAVPADAQFVSNLADHVEKMMDECVTDEFAARYTSILADLLAVPRKAQAETFGVPAEAGGEK